ncbi:hypothetical protein [Clostridium autoethanogenum]|nr:hypothetical protein [Clostridium autoethanogenum]
MMKSYHLLKGGDDLEIIDLFTAGILFGISVYMEIKKRLKK